MTGSQPKWNTLFFVALLLLMPGCQWFTNPPMHKPDPHSYSNPHETRVDSLHLSLKVDFDAQTLSGSADWFLVAGHASELILDTYGLDIHSVEGDGQAVPFRLGTHDALLGQALEVSLHQPTERVRIRYSTRKGARALQWLPASQTEGGQHPYLFTQSQSILARTWIPCMDSPGQRFRYTAELEVPPGLLALMSAENPTETRADGRYSFRMNEPVPAYLMALAVGKLEFRSLGKRTGVYAEPAMLERAVHEFADMEQMLSTTESLYGPYVWGRYDVLVLPPSFPFGGMENPRLTFATPTIITGDRSLVSLIAHELAHSWSGNLVTNASWDDFWLNEGFTVYVEMRIMEALYGPEYAAMLSAIAHADVLEEVKSLTLGGQEQKTRLAAHMRGEDPDDGVGPIAYDKGYHFLLLIEQTIGRARWDAFLKKYFHENAFKSMHTEAFLSRLDSLLSTEEERLIGVQEWVYGTGLPVNCPPPVSTRFAAVDSGLDLWRKGDPLALPSEIDAWSTHEWVYFIRQLDERDSLAAAELDRRFRFTGTTNAEIGCVWYQWVIRFAPSYGHQRLCSEAMAAYMTRIGRRKFIMPLYKALKETGQIDRARELYKQARPNYHSVASHSVDALLGWKEE